jgi:hypothetical protein
MQKKHTLAAWAALFLAAPAAHAATLVQMNLAELTARSGRILRGTVVSVDAGTVEAGGGQVPMVAYRLAVADTLKGARLMEGDGRVVEIRMVGLLRSARTTGDHRSAPLLLGLPELEMGQEYLLFTTAPSRVGLSTTVGFGQGAFRIHGQGGAETAVNAFGNVGLFDRMTPSPARVADGPIPYSDLAGRVRALVGR